MNRSSLLLITALALSPFGVACRTSGSTGVTAASGSEAHRLVAAGAVLLDVRTPEEFAEGHLSGALNVPVDDLAGRVGEVPAGRSVVVYCASGIRSARGAQILRAAGRGDVHDLGPMSAWDER